MDQLAAHPYYWLTLTLNTDPFQVEGTERVHYCNMESETLQDIVFRLYPNTLLNETILRIGRVEVEGQPVNTVLEAGDSVLRVPLTHGLLPGQVVVIDLSFTLELPTDLAEVGYGRLSRLEGTTLLSSFFPLLSVHERNKWWLAWPDHKGDPVYSETAFFDVMLIAPAGIQVASSGITLESMPKNNTVTHRLVSGPVRDFSLALSADFELLSSVQDGVTVNIWSMPGSHEADLIALESTIAALEIFDEQFGPYPFSEFDVVEAPISALGIEYPGLTDIASRIWQDDNAMLERVIVHEVAHQWWYSMVGNDQVGEPWLDEGLAEYSVELFYRDKQGLQGAQAVRSYFQTEVNDYISARDLYLPVGLPVSAYTDQEYRTFVYSKGGLFYGQLQDQYGLEKEGTGLSANVLRTLSLPRRTQCRPGVHDRQLLWAGGKGAFCGLGLRLSSPRLAVPTHNHSPIRRLSTSLQALFVP